MKRILLVVMLIFFGTLNIHEAKASTDSVVQGKFEFEYEPTKGGVWITRITPLSNKGIATLKIPAKIKGKKVVKFGTKALKNAEWQDNGYGENVFGVGDAPEDADYPCEPMDIYKRTKKIKKIRIPETVKMITQHTFIHFYDGKSINIPKNVGKNVENLAYYKWKKITISPKNKKYKKENGCLLSKDGKILYGFLEERDKIVVPQTVKTLMTGVASAYDGVSTIVLPKGLRNIEDEGLEISSNVTIKVAKGNKKYAAKHGCLYNKKTGRLVTACAPDGVFRIPEGVTYVTGYYVLNGVVVDDTGTRHRVGGVSSTMIVPESVKQLENLLKFSTTKNFICVMQGKTPPELMNPGVFGVENVTIYVPKGCKTAYEQAWKMETGVTVTYIEQE